MAPFLIWLLCVGIGAIILGFYLTRSNPFDSMEGFQAGQDFTLKMTACPPVTTSYKTSAGDTNCCRGEVVNGKCNETDIWCSLSPQVDGKIKTCSQWLTDEWKKMGAQLCPKSMPFYFGSVSSKENHGCSETRASEDGSKPQMENAKQCKNYLSSSDELGNLDSCFNVKQMESVECPTPDAVKSMVHTGKEGDKKLPVLFACSYTPPNKSSLVPVMCYDEERAKIYMKAKYGGEWEAKLKEKGLKLGSMLQLCPASRKYYVDGSMKADAMTF